MTVSSQTLLSESPTAPRLGVSGAPSRAKVDVPLLAIVGALLAVGLPMIVSASVGDTDYLWRQLAGIGIGAALAAVLYFVDSSALRRAIPALFGGALVLQVLLFTPLGHEVNGARRWLALYGLLFQPSEVVRLGVILMLGDYLAKHRGRLNDTGVTLRAFGLVLIPMLFMIPQKDLGSMVIMFGLGVVLMYVAGLSWRFLGPALACGGVGAIPLVYAEGYRIERILSYFDPFQARDDVGYQVVEGWIAFANGAWFGVGYANGGHDRLPAAHTDLIGAVLAEEWGATGFAVLVLLQWALLWRATWIALRSRELFDMLVASGIGTLFGAQAAINLGVICGLVPSKGLVLPFVSYGASAIIVHVACVGLLLKISAVREEQTWRTADS